MDATAERAGRPATILQPALKIAHGGVDENSQMNIKDNKQMGNLTIAIMNWQQLTSGDGQIRIGPMTEGLAVASSEDADVILGSELGTEQATKHIARGRYVAEWSIADKVMPGQAVGVFIDNDRWEGMWVVIQEPSAPKNSRFYLLQAHECRILIGVFDAPQRGHGKQIRMAFCRRLVAAWRRVQAAHPDAWPILGGEANVPEFFQDVDGVRELQPRGTAAAYIKRNIIDGTTLCNAAAGAIQPTHKCGGTLDLLVTHVDIPVLHFKVTETGIAGSHHSMGVGRFAIPGCSKPPPQPRWRANPEACWEALTLELAQPLRAWHNWVCLR